MGYQQRPTHHHAQCRIHRRAAKLPDHRGQAVQLWLGCRRQSHQRKAVRTHDIEQFLAGLGKLVPHFPAVVAEKLCHQQDPKGVPLARRRGQQRATHLAVGVAPRRIQLQQAQALQQLMQASQGNGDLHEIAFIPIPEQAKPARGRREQLQVDLLHGNAAMANGLDIRKRHFNIEIEQQPRQLGSIARVGRIRAGGHGCHRRTAAR